LVLSLNERPLTLSNDVIEFSNSTRAAWDSLYKAMLIVKPLSIGTLRGHLDIDPGVFANIGSGKHRSSNLQNEPDLKRFVLLSNS